MKKAFLLAVFALMVIPVYLMFIGGFQAMNGLMKMPPNLIPWNATLVNFARIADWPYLPWIRNTGIVLVSTVGLSVMVCCMTGYVFAVYQFRHKAILWAVLLVGLMIPRISLLIPTYVVMKHLGLSGTLAAVILPISYYPVGMYLARNYFETIPRGIIESARLDGASEWSVLTRIVMPMSQPIVTCLALFSAINALGDYIWQMLVLQREGERTLLVGLIQRSLTRSVATSADVNPWGVSLAVGSILLFPLLVMFIAANKYFTQSIGGAIKE